MTLSFRSSAALGRSGLHGGDPCVDRAPQGGSRHSCSSVAVTHGPGTSDGACAPGAFGVSHIALRDRLYPLRIAVKNCVIITMPLREGSLRAAIERRLKRSMHHPSR